MLVLTRKHDEWIDLVMPDGRVVGVMVQDIRGGSVRLGVQAPDDVMVTRPACLGRERNRRDGGSDGRR